MTQLADIFLRTAGIYLFIILALRLFGKKELAQLSIIDLVFILLISDSVQNAMVGPDTSLVGGLIAAGTLFVLNFVLKFISYRSKRLSRLLQGGPVLLIHEGKVIPENLDRVKISMEELQAALREHGIADESGADLAVLESDGNISILSHNYQRRTVRRRRAHKAIAKNT